MLVVLLPQAYPLRRESMDVGSCKFRPGDFGSFRPIGNRVVGSVSFRIQIKCILHLISTKGMDKH